MGRWNKTVAPARGVRCRKYASGRQAIQIAFAFRGVECREVLRGLSWPEDIDQANALKATIDREIGLGTFDYAHHFPDSKRAAIFGHGASSTTVRDLATEFLEDVEHGLESSTARKYRASVETWILPQFGRLPISQLTTPVIVDRVKALGRRGLALKTIRNHMTVLRGILALAMRKGLIDSNPALGIRPSDVVPRREARKSGYRVDPFTVAEIDAIVDAAAAMDPLWGNYFEFALFTGLRTGEMYTLAWLDVDLPGGTVTVARSFDPTSPPDYIKLPKTDAGIRRVQLLERAEAALRRQRAETQAAGHGWVWVPSTRRPFTSYASSDGPWHRILKAAGVRYRNQYQTRHTCASQMLTQGEDPWWLARQMGHKTIEEIIKVYGKWIDQAEGPRQMKGDFGKA